MVKQSNADVCFDCWTIIDDAITILWNIRNYWPNNITLILLHFTQACDNGSHNSDWQLRLLQRI
jgi:hypothetical protein